MFFPGSNSVNHRSSHSSYLGPSSMDSTRREERPTAAPISLPSVRTLFPNLMSPAAARDGMYDLDPRMLFEPLHIPARVEDNARLQRSPQPWTSRATLSPPVAGPSTLSSPASASLRRLLNESPPPSSATSSSSAADWDGYSESAERHARHHVPRHDLVSRTPIAERSVVPAHQQTQQHPQRLPVALQVPVAQAIPAASAQAQADAQAKNAKKKHVCGQCGARYLRPSELKMHQHKHTGERPFVCTVCRRHFTTQFNLGRHMRSIHAVGNDTPSSAVGDPEMGSEKIQLGFATPLPISFDGPDIAPGNRLGINCFVP